MAQKTWIKVSGIWRDVSMVWRKTGGSWQNYVLVWHKVGGVWKQVMTYPAPSTPSYLNLSQPTTGDHILAGWENVSGATGFRLQRKPYYSGSWVNSWKEVYTGSNNTFADDIQLEGPMTDGDTVTYKVNAYNDFGESAYTGEQTINWMDI